MSTGSGSTCGAMSNAWTLGYPELSVCMIHMILSAVSRARALLSGYICPASPNAPCLPFAFRIWCRWRMPADIPNPLICPNMSFMPTASYTDMIACPALAVNASIIPKAP